ncbi:sugar ABC transporter substrate-binding protein [Brachybacterium vulturis]|uniref:Sugar ABC transporter substrate-binding protein n=1 Tax=Brachybacterium vulturis TaxID=2017484 RepID=A0A291GLF8_9MICO|nr:ABC transporter substrate-binding protein [Brachybacterium vulturis]ATG50794.1 sugar ABC transporter substrate-binding protein [Brachybacterium vulturis]
MIRSNKARTVVRAGAALAVSALALAGCGGAADETAEGGGGDESYSIGISQYVTHPSLDAAREGFMSGLEDAGLDVSFDVQNAQGDQATANTIAGTFANSDHDLLLAIATPSAQTLAQSIRETPVLFTAVTDPESAKLVDSNEEPGGNVTGTSDANPVREQLQLLTELAPDAETVGIVYSSGEVNSQVQVDWAKEAAAELGIEIQEATVSNSSEVQQAANSLDVDAIYVPTDNAVVSALESVIRVGQNEQIPVVAADGASVERGAVATYGINYEELGAQTAEMAVRILTEGADPATMAVETQTQPELYVNPTAAEKMGVEIPQAMLDEADHVVGEGAE